MFSSRRVNYESIPGLQQHTSKREGTISANLNVPQQHKSYKLCTWLSVCQGREKSKQYTPQTLHDSFPYCNQAVFVNWTATMVFFCSLCSSWIFAFLRHWGSVVMISNSSMDSMDSFFTAQYLACFEEYLHTCGYVGYVGVRKTTCVEELVEQRGKRDTVLVCIVLFVYFHVCCCCFVFNIYHVSYSFWATMMVFTLSFFPLFLLFW